MLKEGLILSSYSKSLRSPTRSLVKAFLLDNKDVDGFILNQGSREMKCKK